MTDEEAIDEARSFNEALAELSASAPRVELLEPASVRRARREGRGIFPAPVFHDEAQTIEIDGRDGRIPLRIVEVPEPRGAYLHIHGGGWVFGAGDLQDTELVALAHDVQHTVVSVDYRLAPEHPYPAGLDDCDDAARWFLERFGHLPRLTIGGESAGAHYSVLTLLRLRDDGIDGFAGANLVFGAFDLTGTPSRHLWGDRNLVLTSPLMDWFADCLVPGLTLGERRAPAISPLYADLRGLPPALFTCGLLDPLLDDTLFMEARWRAAGNEARLSLWDEGVHGFTAFPIEIARRSFAEQHAFVAQG